VFNEEAPKKVWKSGSAKLSLSLPSPTVFWKSHEPEDTLRFRGDAFRTIYAVQIGEALWVIHAFKKKSTQGIKTPKRELDLIRDRLKTLKEMLR